MVISLNNIIPRPLQDIYPEQSIWGRSHKLDAAQYYLVNAASGRGKSTLVSYIYGLRKDYSGALLLDDTNAQKLTLNQWADMRQNKLAVVFQDLRLFDDLTAMENIEIKRKLTNHITHDDVMHMAETLGVTTLLNRKARLLSMGQQQRIAIIRALTQPFQWLLLDEPYSHLDTDNIQRAEQLIDSYCKRNNAGLILTTLGEPYNLSYQQTITV